MKKDVFISYSSKDFDKVNSVKNILEINGISCWMAPQCIPPGSSYAKEIPMAIKNCKVYLNQSVYDDVAFKRIVYSKWLIAVTYKQERNFGYANELCEDLIDCINDENQIFEVPYTDSLLLPQRELIVINKEEIMSDFLLIHMDDISMNPKELFYTQRRLLELYILAYKVVTCHDIDRSSVISHPRCIIFSNLLFACTLSHAIFQRKSKSTEVENTAQKKAA